jgi:exodeoxyribonuclease VIII
MKHRDVMIDIETLGNTPDATVLTIAGIAFDRMGHYGMVADPTTLDFYYARVEIDHQNRQINEDTVDWWAKQPEEAKTEAFHPDQRIPLDIAMIELNKWASGADRYWANGAGFDFTILESCNRQFNNKSPWNFWQVLDARTIYKMVPDHFIPQNNKHHALWDCLSQIQRLTECFHKLGVYPNK